MKLISLPYTLDITPVFDKIARFDWSIWLDSGDAKKFNQRYDIITGFPYKTITANVNNTIVRDLYYNSQLKKINSSFQRFSNNQIDPLQIINNIIIENKPITQDSNFEKKSDIPFWHGAVGYFSYDLNQILYKQIKKQKYNSDIPIMAVGIYAWALIYDHYKKKSYIAYDANKISDSAINKILEIFSETKKTDYETNNNTIKNFFSSNQFIPSRTIQEYNDSYQKIKTHIKDGDCYQINYAIPFNLTVKNCPAGSFDFYQYLKKFNANPFCSYFRINKNLSILSFSPERFLKLENNIVTSEPIKGTRKNIENNDELNLIIKNELQNNPKDRAENIMITDLLRNDMNKFCVPGSVVATKICEIHSFPTVHHLKSTIQGELKENYNALDLVKGCFPGGSITGAPKIRAMQIIQELENNNNSITRYIYCGSIGYININQNMDLNIAIRTSLQYKNNYYYWAGGGIVADSDNIREFDEIYTKLLRTV